MSAANSADSGKVVGTTPFRLAHSWTFPYRNSGGRMKSIWHLARMLRRHISMATSGARVFAVAVMLMGMSGCHDSRQGSVAPGPKDEAASVLSLTDKNGDEYPYFKYEGSGSFFAKYGWAMFVYPIYGTRNRGLALTYREGDDIRSLFGEELFGKDFSVTSRDGILVVEGFPISRPFEIDSKSKWKMRHEKKIFDCGVTRMDRDGFDVACFAPMTRIALAFGNDGAVTSFQDACETGMCTYKLVSGGGLLSPYHLRIVMPQASERHSDT